MMEYIRRIVDDEISKRMEAFNAINIIGPKGCGKRERQKNAVRQSSNFRMKISGKAIWRLLKHPRNCF